MNHDEFMKKLTEIVHTYEEVNDNKVIGVYVDDDNRIFEWNGESFDTKPLGIKIIFVDRDHDGIYTDSISSTPPVKR